MLVFTRRNMEEITIRNRETNELICVITVVGVTKRAQLGFSANKKYKIDRREVDDRIQAERKDE